MSKAFLQALASGNPEAVKSAASPIVADNKKRSVDLLIKGLKTAGPQVYWSLIRAIGGIQSEEGLTAVADEILSSKIPETKRDLVLSLSLSEGMAVPALLRRIFKMGTPDLQVSALDELADRLDYDAAPLLLEAAEKDPAFGRELTRRIYCALRTLAKEPPTGAPSEWRRWWEAKNPQHKEPQPGAQPVLSRQTVTESLRPVRATQFEDLRRGDKERVLVMTGEYDAVQEVLVSLEIPHTTTSVAALKRANGNPFEGASAVFLNCDSIGDWPKALVVYVTEYVAKGGYLFVSDLGVQHLVRHAFPGFMEFKSGNLSAQTVAILPAKGITGHPFMRGVNLVQREGRVALSWQIDEGGPALQFDPKKVIPLIQSPELELKRKPPTLALTFSYPFEVKAPGEAGSSYGGIYEEPSGKSGGKVLCVLSHFKNQRRDEDGFALQNLLLNFLIEANDHFAMRKGKAEKR